MAEYFTVRLNKIWIRDNREIGSAEVNVMSFITAGDVQLPTLDGLLRTNDMEEKKSIMRAAAIGVLSSRRLIRFDHIKDKQFLVFGDTGISIYTADKIPRDINVQIIVIEKDDDVRKMGKKISSIVSSSSFDSFSSNLLMALGTAVNPTVTASIEVVKFLGRFVGDIMRENSDDQIGVFLASLDRFQDYKHLQRQAVGASGVGGNIKVDYTIFGTIY